MKASRLLDQTFLYLKQRSPLILTCVGSIGVIATAAMAIKTTPKAVYLIDEAECEKHEKLTKMEVITVAGPAYIPTVLVGAATIACIFGANILNRRQQAAITSAYILLERTYKDYKNKIVELYGKDGLQKVHTAIVKDKYDESKIQPKDPETCIFYEEHYGKLFERTMLEVQDAEYRINRKFALEGEASLNDFFEFLGLEPTKSGNMLGWSQEASYDFYNYSWIEFEHELVTMDDGMECYMINMPFEPTLGFSLPF